MRRGVAFRCRANMAHIRQSRPWLEPFCRGTSLKPFSRCSLLARQRDGKGPPQVPLYAITQVPLYATTQVPLNGTTQVPLYATTQERDPLQKGPEHVFLSKRFEDVFERGALRPGRRCLRRGLDLGRWSVRSVPPTPYTTLLHAPCNMHPAPRTLHPIPCTLHPIPCTLHPTLQTHDSLRECAGA